MHVRKFLVLLILVVLLLNCCQTVSKKIVVYGDTRTQVHIHSEIIAAIVQTEPAAVFHTGDLVTDGYSFDDWDIFNYVTKDLLKMSRFYPALGNHEGHSRLYFDNFTLPNNERWYSVDIKKVHFIVLDTNSDITGGSPQYKWLENDLENVGKKNRYRVVILHHPPFSSGPHRQDEKGLRQSVVPLFEKHGVDVVFCGHDHFYERLFRNNVYYIITAGGGAPLYQEAGEDPNSQFFSGTYHFCLLSIEKGELVVEVLDKDLKKIDGFRVPDGGV